MPVCDLTTNHPESAPKRHPAMYGALVLGAMLVWAWAGIVAGVYLALAPQGSAADLAEGLGWTVVISAVVGVAFSALYNAIASDDRD